jgi:hypothetical protein
MILYAIRGQPQHFRHPVYVYMRILHHKRNNVTHVPRGNKLQKPSIGNLLGSFLGSLLGSKATSPIPTFCDLPIPTFDYITIREIVAFFFVFKCFYDTQIPTFAVIPIPTLGSILANIDRKSFPLLRELALHAG